MARGKTKFKRKKGEKNKFSRKNNKNKKTYSIFNKNDGKSKIREHFKVEEPPVKKQKVDFRKRIAEVAAENDVVQEDNHMHRLLMSFGQNVLVKRKIANSSDEEGTSDDESDVNSEIKNNESSTKTPEDESDNEIVDENEIDLETQEDDEGVVKDVTDPFCDHYLYDLSEKMLLSLQINPVPVIIEDIEWEELGKMQIKIPKCEQVEQNSKLILVDNKPYAKMGKVPSQINLKTLSTSDIFIKNQIKNNLLSANKIVGEGSDCFFTPLQCEIFSIINNYQDFYYPGRNLENGEEIRFVYCVHAVNHILKTRGKILHHNAKLAQRDDVPEEFRDQGLVRPKVLILAPFRDSAYKIINFIINMLFKEDKGNVMNKLRFIEEFTGHELALPKKNPKPEDYEKIFAGNSGDEFKIGITITKKSLKLFADFYSSDIIIASPLGLRTIIGAEGEPDRDYDFLASIELLILDQTEIFLMQNWDHVLHIFNHIHLQPKTSHGVDFSRVRTWTLNGWSKYYRQTLIFSSVVLPEINALFNSKCFNYAGKVKVTNPIKHGTICQVFVQLPHVFQKFYAQNVIEMVEERFKFFVEKIVPQHSDSLMKQTLVYVTNYFDFVRLRNHFKREDVSFVQICEYSKEGKVARARDMFFHGDAQFLLYTERFHFFNRIRVKGIRHLIFYSPPTFPHFYYEMCNLMQEANMNKKVGSMSNMTVTVLYSKYDVNQLATVVGTDRAVKMLESERNVHMLVTDAKNNANK